MDPIRILALIGQYATFGQALVEMVGEAKGVLSTADEPQLQAALAQVQASNDALYARTQAMLADAAKQGD